MTWRGVDDYTPREEPRRYTPRRPDHTPRRETLRESATGGYTEVPNIRPPVTTEVRTIAVTRPPGQSAQTVTTTYSCPETGARLVCPLCGKPSTHVVSVALYPGESVPRCSIHDRFLARVTEGDRQ
jgi:hypothetical protein